MYGQCRCRPLCAFRAPQLREAGGFGRQLAGHQGHAVSTSGSRGARLPKHEGVAVRGQRVLQLAGQCRRPADGVGRVAVTELFVCENERTVAAMLEEGREGVSMSQRSPIKIAYVVLSTV